MENTLTLTTILTILSLIATLILVAITAWYARSTALMLKQMRDQAHLFTISVQASVEGGITNLPPPGQVSAAASEAYANLKELREEIWSLRRKSKE